AAETSRLAACSPQSIDRRLTLGCRHPSLDYGRAQSFSKTRRRGETEHHGDLRRRREEAGGSRRGDPDRCARRGGLEGRSRAWREASQPRRNRDGNRGYGLRSDETDHLLLRRREPLRARRGKPAKNGLRKCALARWRIPRLEGSGFAERWRVA